MTKLNYKSYNDLLNVIRKNIGKLSNNYDLIVGNPRSGMVPAYVIGLLLNKPVLSLTEYVNSIQPSGGERTDRITVKRTKRLILVIDDSIHSGRGLQRCKAKLFATNNEDSFQFLAIFACPDGMRLCDIVFEIVEMPRIFEWNILHSWIYSKACVDLDGVLCEDPTEEENDDSERYINFILNAKLKYLPPVKIKYIVTSRLERYRKETEVWLAKNSIEYESLIMLDLPSAELRRKLNIHAKFKAEVYLKKSKHALIFIESSARQAKEINKLTKLPVFSVEGLTFFHGYLEQRGSSNIYFKLSRKAKNIAKNVIKKLRN